MATKKRGQRVFVVGVGMTKFLKPMRDDTPDYPLLFKQAVGRALRDAGLSLKEVEAAAVSYVYGESTSGNRALYEVGMVGIPIYNVNNNCASGSTALHIAYNQVAGGLYDCVLAGGFEKMEKGSLAGPKYRDRTIPIDKCFKATAEILPDNKSKAPFAAQIFGNAGIEHMKRFGTKEEHFAKIGYKNHKHSVNNPYSQFRDQYTLEQVKQAPVVYGPLTKLSCCPTSDGAAATILVSEKFLHEHKLEDQAVEILGIALTTDTNASFETKSLMNIAGYQMTKRAAEQVYAQSGVRPEQVGVVELHDCFAANELISYEALGLCPEGKAGEFIDRGDNTYGGRVVVNPSGGLISKGHPLGATGLSQVAELSWQLRGMASERQVPNVKYALQHNLGLGGACVVALYKKYNDKKGWSRADQTQDPDLLEKLESQQPKL